jgi:ParB family chromosome partitioning protein
MTTEARKRFGSSLNPILGVKAFPEDNKTVSTQRRLENIMVQKLEPGKFQPRREFDISALEDLSASIREQGILQPLVVRETQKGVYEIIAGERRWRAAQMAGLQQVPVVISAITDEEALAFGVIENIQRQDLNPVEEAIALNRLIEEFGMTHEQVSKSVGKSRSSVSNILRILKLSSHVRDCLIKKQINLGHAKSLVVLPPEQQDKICDEIINNKYNARNTEKMVKSVKEHGIKNVNHSHPRTNEWKKSIEHMLQMKVDICVDKRGKGKVTISVDGEYQLDQIVDSLS